MADDIDQFVHSQMESQHIPGVAVAIVRDGKLIRAQGYGMSNVELAVKVKPQTVFQIQSITKQFTAVGVLMLVEKGLVDLDKPVENYLPGSPILWHKITVRHLFCHTSGLKDYINDPTQSLLLEVTDEEVFRVATQRMLNFEPGEKYEYCNTNYLLLGMIIHRITGKPYGEFLTERIFKPLGMKNTAIVRLDELIPDRSSGYQFRDDKVVNGDYIAGSVLSYPGGGIRSTVQDLAKWDLALDGEKLLKQSTLQAAWTSGKLNSGEDAGYGFGWRVSVYNGHRLVEHSGAHRTGFRTHMVKYLDDHLTLIVLTNMGSANPEVISRGIAGRLIPELMPAEK